jgi:DNA-directed RNA polymerase subunit K/omega
MGEEFGENDNEEFIEEEPEPAFVLTRIPGVGPKTAEKLVAAGYGDVEKIAVVDAETLAGAVPGLSEAKAEVIINEAKSFLEETAAEAEEKGKKTKRKKSAEAEPTKIELPPATELTHEDQVASLQTGYDREKKEMGVPVGPKWLTKYEKARVIGARALQISMGAPVLIDMSTAPKGLFALAEAELKAGALPMTVRRTLPTGEYHDIPLSILLKSTKLD